MCFLSPVFAPDEQLITHDLAFVSIGDREVDLGDGSNGKTLLQRIAEVAFGDYAEQIKETMMTKDPPPPGSACPDLLNMRGVRYLCTPEVETKQAIKSSWIKKLPDKRV